MDKNDIETFYPLSPMQQGMYFHSMLAPESGVYVEQMSCLIHGDFNIPAFQYAWNRVIERHTILRTSFTSGGSTEPVQVVYRKLSVEIQQQDWSGYDRERQQQLYLEFLNGDRVKGFAFDKPPLMRLALLRLGKDEHRFVWSHHHILLDGWSMPFVFREVLGYYQAKIQQRELHLEPARPYRDYIGWLYRQDMKQAETYWRKTLKDFNAPTSLPVQYGERETAQMEGGYQEREIRLPAEKTRLLQQFAARSGVTMSTLVSSGWAILLYRYCGEEDICFGITVSGRPADLPEAEKMVGLFINTLPVRVIIDPQKAISAWLKELQVQLVEMRNYEYSPLVRIQGWSQVRRGQSLFETILVYENYPVQALMAGTNIAGDTLRIDNIESVEQTNYPITAVAGVADELMLKIVYDRQVFDDEFVDRMLGHWGMLLENIATWPDAPLGKIQMLTPAEWKQIVQDWNDNNQTYPDRICAHQWFEEQVALTPNSIAIDFEGQTITYEELNKQSNQLAHAMQQKGVQTGSLVGLCLERSIDVYVAILAALKAGGAYVPLDPAFPADRLAFMISDADLHLLCTQSHLCHRFTNLNLPVIDIDGMRTAFSEQPVINMECRGKAGDLAYVIYTSGSTGKPKGTLLEHRGLCNLAAQYQALFKPGVGCRVLQFFSYSFDGSVADIFMTLLSGATLVAGRTEVLRPGIDLGRFLDDQRINIAMLTPSTLAATPWRELPQLGAILTGGEVCSREIVEIWQPGRRFINAYGPTEATVAAALYEIQDINAEGQSIPIGQPPGNVKIYIVDKNMNPVPVGISGEICIGGVGVGRGYLNRPELTAERFIEDPFLKNHEGRLYRSGDLGRYRKDGNIEFIGRIDDQVKLRGFRIELGEIETVLQSYPGINQAAVVLQEIKNGDKRLAAFITGNPITGTGGDLHAVQEYLRKRLPEYMTPAAITMIDQMPILPTGKINRGALITMETTPLARQNHELVAPRDLLEAQLATIWEEVLGIQRVGVADDFFELGGHSLSAVRVIGQVEQQLGKQLSLTSLFEEPTIEHLASLLRETKTSSDIERSLLISMQKKGEKPPVFFIHPSGGSVHFYTDLAHAMGRERPFYGIQAQGMNRDAPIHTRIEEMAELYRRVIQSRVPEGPFLLGSWSLGVVIAYEIAQQLSYLGFEVGFLGMLDQGPVLPAKEPEDDADYLAGVFGAHVPVTVEMLRRLDQEEQISLVWKEARRVHFIFPDVTRDQFAFFIRILRTQTEAWRRYRPQPYNGHLTLFRAQEQGDEAPAERDMGWGRLVTGGVSIIDVPGDHLSMIHPPHVKLLAQRMRENLEIAEKYQIGHKNGEE